MMENNEKVYFLPGDLVKFRRDLPNSPTMLVVKKVTSKYKSASYFQGILCRWFTTEGLLQEAIWNTKDITKI